MVYLDQAVPPDLKSNGNLRYPGSKGHWKVIAVLTLITTPEGHTHINPLLRVWRGRDKVSITTELRDALLVTGAGESRKLEDGKNTFPMVQAVSTKSRQAQRLVHAGIRSQEIASDFPAMARVDQMHLESSERKATRSSSGVCQGHQQIEIKELEVQVKVSIGDFISFVLYCLRVITMVGRRTCVVLILSTLLIPVACHADVLQFDDLDCGKLAVSGEGYGDLLQWIPPMLTEDLHVQPYQIWPSRGLNGIWFFQGENSRTLRITLLDCKPEAEWTDFRRYSYAPGSVNLVVDERAKPVYSARQECSVNPFMALKYDVKAFRRCATSMVVPWNAPLSQAGYTDFAAALTAETDGLSFVRFLNFVQSSTTIGMICFAYNPFRLMLLFPAAVSIMWSINSPTSLFRVVVILCVALGSRNRISTCRGLALFMLNFLVMAMMLYCGGALFISIAMILLMALNVGSSFKGEMSPLLWMLVFAWFDFTITDPNSTVFMMKMYNVLTEVELVDSSSGFCRVIMSNWAMSAYFLATRCLRSLVMLHFLLQALALDPWVFVPPDDTVAKLAPNDPARLPFILYRPHRKILECFRRRWVSITALMACYSAVGCFMEPIVLYLLVLLAYVGAIPQVKVDSDQREQGEFLRDVEVHSRTDLLLPLRPQDALMYDTVVRTSKDSIAQHCRWTKCSERRCDGS